MPQDGDRASAHPRALARQIELIAAGIQERIAASSAPSEHADGFGNTLKNRLNICNCAALI